MEGIAISRFCEAIPTITVGIGSLLMVLGDSPWRALVDSAVDLWGDAARGASPSDSRGDP